MGETKIIVISRHLPQTLLGKFRQSLKLVPRNTGKKIIRTYEAIRKKEK